MKQYLKRIIRYLIYGIPINNVCVNVSSIEKGDVLKNRYILITGGGTGIGLAIAQRCVEEGANVIFTI